MTKVKIRIDMDEGWQWWPIINGEYISMRKAPTLEVDQELIDRYEAAVAVMRPIKEALENLYRIQEGLKPWDDQPIPDHTVLTRS